MRKFTCISLLLLLFFSLAGYYLLYLVQEHRWEETRRHEIISGLPLSQLDSLDADKEAAFIEWEEEGREFYFHGHLYDVAAIKKVSGKTIIYCLNDAKEEQLLRERSAAVSTLFDQDHKGKQAPHSFTFQLPDFLISSEPLTFSPLPERTFVFAYKTSFQSAGSSINSLLPN